MEGEEMVTVPRENVVTSITVSPPYSPSSGGGPGKDEEVKNSKSGQSSGKVLSAAAV